MSYIIAWHLHILCKNMDSVLDEIFCVLVSTYKKNNIHWATVWPVLAPPFTSQVSWLSNILVVFPLWKSQQSTFTKWPGWLDLCQLVKKKKKNIYCFFLLFWEVSPSYTDISQVDCACKQLDNHGVIFQETFICPEQTYKQHHQSEWQVTNRPTIFGWCFQCVCFKCRLS